VRVVAIHEDVVVAVGAIWKTTCTAVRAGGEALLIDSPILPEELEALPEALEGAGFPVGGLFATHADWDHLLGRHAFPGAPLACAASTAARLAAAPEEAAEELREFDEQYMIDRPAPLDPVVDRELPVPGRLPLGESPAPGVAALGEPGSNPPTEDAALELLPAEGHTADGAAVWIPWAEVLVCGDYLSPRAIPELSPSSSLDAYLATLKRLAPLVERAAVVVPGHGEPLSAARAAAVLREDVAYIEALAAGAKAFADDPARTLDPTAVPLPPSRDDGGNRSLHEHNVGLASQR
jgi:glyoxylase-like metal-dependent hydrolase (beta-lactamase superfamily II)